MIAGSYAVELRPSGEPGFGGALTGKPSLELGGGDLQVFYKDLGRDVVFTLRSAGLPVLHLDVNGNGAVDRTVDLTYAVFPNGQPCIQYLRVQGDPAECGTFRSSASARAQRSGGIWEVTWTIPKTEVSDADEKRSAGNRAVLGTT